MNAKLHTGRKQKLVADHRALLLICSHPGSEHCATDFEEVHHRAETITPLLQKILEFRPPPHWK